MDYQILTLVDGDITLSSGDNPDRISGINELIQVVLIELLSDFDARTGRGTDMLKNINDIAISQPEQFPIVVAQALAVAEQHIKQLQTSSQWLTDDARISRLEYIRSSVSSGAFKIAFRLVNVTNQQVIVEVPV